MGAFLTLPALFVVGFASVRHFGLMDGLAIVAALCVVMPYARVIKQ